MYGMGLWVLDLLMRFLYLASIKHAQRCTITYLPGDVVKIEIPNPGCTYL